MKHITLNGASFLVSFVQGFKKVEAFIAKMEGHIPDWKGDERVARLKSVWNTAHGKAEAPAPKVEAVPEPTQEVTE